MPARKETRQRSIRRHVTANEGPRQVKWASPTQEAVFKYGPAPVCASGGFGSAKTWALCLKALWLSDTFPGNRGVIARRVWEELKHTTLASFYKICPPEAYSHGGKRSDSEKYLRLNNGSEILWLHLDDPETENVIRGLEINWFFIDQAEETDEELYDLLSSRLGRWDKAKVPQWMIDAEKAQGRDWAWKNPAGDAIVPTYSMLACNPDTELHWIYKRFHPDSPEWREKYSKQGYRLFTMASTENQFLPKQNLDNLMAKDESFVRRFVRGEWGIPEGQIHEVPKESMIPGTPSVVSYITQKCKLFRILDHGDAAPTCCLWGAVDEQGNLFIYREYYMPNKLISEHRSNIAGMSMGERYTCNYADQSIFHKIQKGGMHWSVADEYSDCKALPRTTALFWDPADKDEMGTRNRISEYLRLSGDEKGEPRVHPLGGILGLKEKGKWPRLFFITKTPDYQQGCDHVVRQARSQRRKRIGTDLGKPIFSDDRDDNIADHAYDCLRYFVASRPAAPTGVTPGLPYMAFDAVRARNIAFKRRGGFRELARLAGRRSA